MAMRDLLHCSAVETNAAMATGALEQNLALATIATQALLQSSAMAMRRRNIKKEKKKKS